MSATLIAQHRASTTVLRSLDRTHHSSAGSGCVMYGMPACSATTARAAPARNQSRPGIRGGAAALVSGGAAAGKRSVFGALDVMSVKAAFDSERHIPDSGDCIARLASGPRAVPYRRLHPGELGNRLRHRTGFAKDRGHRRFVELAARDPLIAWCFDAQLHATALNRGDGDHDVSVNHNRFANLP